jgi:hypothetical protein
VRRALDGLPSGGDGVDGSHQTVDDTKVGVNNLGERGKAVDLFDIYSSLDQHEKGG